MPTDSGAYARRIFVFYFRTTLEAAGGTWDADNDAEIESAIDDLIAAAKEGRS